MILWVDAFVGIAGDMLVAALVHAGAPLDAVLADVRAVGVPGWTARVERVTRGPYAATRFVVEPEGVPSLLPREGVPSLLPREGEKVAAQRPDEGASTPRVRRVRFRRVPSLLPREGEKVEPEGVPSLLPREGEVVEPEGVPSLLPREGEKVAAQRPDEGASTLGGHDDAHHRDHAHAHAHAHDHSHTHAHDHHDDSFPGQPQRDWATIRALLTAAPLPARVRARALAVFAGLARAEARVHGMRVDEVQFHEVGAVDSIVDIVAACSALEHLGVDRIVSTALPMGQGAVRTQHGLLPVPVPATVEVLCGFPVVSSALRGELVTPTGAALIAMLATPGPMPSMTPVAVGYGAGTRNPASHANVLRVVLGRPVESVGVPVGRAGSAPASAEDTTPRRVVELSAQVDDLPGEQVPPLLAALFTAGALDAFVVPVLMKKGRSGLWVHALCVPEAQGAVGEALLRHSGSFGYRAALLDREVLDRRQETVVTRFGPLRVKVGLRDGAVIHQAPEFEDCAAAALAHDVPISAVYAAALAAREPE